MKYEYVKPVEGEAEYIRDGAGVSHALADVAARTAAEALAVRCTKAESDIKDHTHERFDNDVEIGGSHTLSVKEIKGKAGVLIHNKDGSASVEVDSKGNIDIMAKSGGTVTIGRSGNSSAVFDETRWAYFPNGAIFNETITSHNIVPSADGEYDLGNASGSGGACKRWKNVYANNVDTDDLTLTRGAAFLQANNDYTGKADSTLSEIFKAVWKAIAGKIGTVDTALNRNSVNPVQNKVIKAELDKKADKNHTHTVDSYMSSTSKNPVENRIVLARLNNLNGQIINLERSINELSYEIEQLKKNGSGSTGSGGGETPKPDTDTRDYSKCKWTEQGDSETLTDDEYSDKASVVWTPNSDFKLKAGDKINFSVSLDAEQIPNGEELGSSVSIEVKFSNNKYYKETCTYDKSKGIPVSTVEAGSISLPYTVEGEMNLPTITMTNNANDYGCNYVQLSSFSINGHSVL